MTELCIDRLSATTAAADEPRVRRLLSGVAAHRLDAALAEVEVPPGEWCVRRLDVPLRLDSGRTDHAVEASWARALTAALRDALAGPTADIVHFPGVADALGDLLGGLALGRTDRAWAWAQLGLIRTGDPDFELAPGAAAVAAFRRRPHEAVAALVAAVRSTGVAALHRFLGPAGWTELARLVSSGLGGDAAVAIPMPATMPATRPAPVPTTVRGSLPGGGSGGARGSGSGPGTGVPRHAPAPSGLTASIVARSSLAAAFERARIRPDDVTAWAWAVLTAAESEPALFGRADARRVVAALAHGYGDRAGASGQRVEALENAEARADRPESEARAEGPPGSGAGGAAVSDSAQHPVGAPADRGPVDDRESRPTRWAGLPFFLATAEAAGLPAALLADDALADRPLAWSICHLGRRLVSAIEETDPALFALAGLVAAEPMSPPSPAEAASLDLHADRWSAVTAARLDRTDESPADVAAQVAARVGEIVAVPGWVEIHLDVRDVDLDVRRAGLDLDPGWVPWLGAVVIFSYE